MSASSTKISTRFCRRSVKVVNYRQRSISETEGEHTDLVQVDERLLEPDGKEPLARGGPAPVEQAEEGAVLRADVVRVREEVERRESRGIELHVLREVMCSDGEGSVVRRVREEGEVGDEGRERVHAEREGELGCMPSRRISCQTSGCAMGGCGWTHGWWKQLAAREVAL